MPISNLLSKIRNALKSKKENTNTAGAQQNGISEEAKISKAAAKNARYFFVKCWPYFLIIIPIIIAIFVRYQSIGITIADDWAEDNVRNFFRDKIKSQISQQYPDLPEANRERIAEEQFVKFAKENKKAIDGQIALNAKQYKDFFQYESGSHSYPYMGDIDSYYWLRQAKNIVEKGYNCDVVENGICYDTYTLAPEKLRVSKSLHPYSIAFVYKAVKPFNKDFTLMQAQLIVPTIYAIITAVIVYIFVLMVRGLLAALVSSVLISVSPIFLTRSIGSDSDIYNIFFPVIIVFFAYLSFASVGWKKKAVFSSIAGLAVGAYSFAWVGWWYLFDFIIIAIFADYFFSVIKGLRMSGKAGIKAIPKSNIPEKQSFSGSSEIENFRETGNAEHFPVRRKSKAFSSETKGALATFLAFVISSFISLSLVSGFNVIKAAYASPLRFTKVKIAANANLWPNVLTTVAEFNEASTSQAIGQVWGNLFFFLALLGIVILLYKNFRNMSRNFITSLPSIAILYYLVTPSGAGLKLIYYLALLGIAFSLALYSAFKSEEETDIKLAVLLLLWTAASIYAAAKGTRFVLLLVPPVAIGIGITFGFLHKTLSSIVASLTKINKAVVAVMLFLVFSYYIIEPVKDGISTAKNYLPNVNDQWWNALAKIKENSKPDAIINSWWDFGHWFKYIADRRVTLDGSSQNHPQLHWLGKLLLTPDEKEAIGILRMLDCGGNQAFSAISKVKNNTPKSIKLLNKLILAKSREQARGMLANEGFSEEESEKVIEYTHCEPPENFLIASEDMIGKGGVWAHFGSWDFDRAWMQQAFRNNDGEAKIVQMFMDEFNYSRETAASYYSEIKGLKSESEVNSWIAPWPGYMGAESCQRISNIIRCPLQQAFVEISLDSMDASIPTSEGIKKPAVFSYTSPSGINVREYHGNAINVGMVLLINKDGSYSSIYMAPQLANSTFTKLFYLDGHGTSYFDLFHESGGSNTDIKVWKVNWDGSKSPRIVERFNVQASS